MPILLVLLVATAVELVVLVAVGQAIGVLATVGLLILASLIGAALLRREGTRTLLAFHEALRSRRAPHREVVDGMLIAAAGVLIVLPGFVSDGLGLLLLLSPTRGVIRRRILRCAERGSAERGPTGHVASGYFTAGHFAPGTVIDGEIVDEEPAHRTGPELR